MSLTPHPSFSGPWRPPVALSSTQATFDCLCFFIYCKRYGFEWGFFFSTSVYYLALLHRHFWLNLRLSRPSWEPAVLPWSLQGFILTSSKHRPGPFVCLIRSNPQSSYSEEFIFKFYQILSWITCGKKFSLYAPYSFQTLFACSKSYVKTITSLAKRLRARLQTKWLWVRVPLQSLRLILTASMNIKVILKKHQSVI